MELTTLERAFVLGFLVLAWAGAVMFIALTAVLVQQFFRAGK